MQKPTINVCWLRRDLRLHDHHALDQALQAGLPVLLLFIFDKNILSQLSDNADKRVTFIHQTLSRLNEELRRFNSSICVVHDTAVHAFPQMLEKFEVTEVFANQDYEPYAVSRDQKISNLLSNNHMGFQTFKDQV